MCECSNQGVTLGNSVKYCPTCGKSLAPPQSAPLPQVGEVWVARDGQQYEIIHEYKDRLIVKRTNSTESIAWRNLNGRMTNGSLGPSPGDLRKKYVEPKSKDVWMCLSERKDNGVLELLQFTQQVSAVIFNSNSHEHWRCLGIKKVTVTEGDIL